MRYFTILLLFNLFISLPARSQTDELIDLETRLTSTTDTVRANLLNKLSWEYRRINTLKSLDYASEAFRFSSKRKYKNGIAFACKNLGMVYSIRGEYDIAEKWLKLSVDKFKTLHNIVEEGNIYNLFGLLYWEQGKYRAAVEYYNHADFLYKKIRDNEGRAIVLGNIGIIYYEQNKYHKALSNYYEALTIANGTNNRFYRANLHTNIGLVYNELKNYNKALQHFNSSLVIENEENNLSGKAKSYTNIANSHFCMKNYDKSLFYNRQALSMYETIGEPKGIARSLINVGELQELKGDFSNAEKTMQQALKISRGMNDRLGITMTLCGLGSIQLQQRNSGEALLSLNHAHELAIQLSSSKYQAVSALLLAKLYELNGNAEKAVTYYKEYAATSDSLSDERTNSRLTELQIGFETKNKQQEIRRLESVSESNAFKKKMAIYGGITVTLLGTLIYTWQRKKHRKEQTEVTGKLLSERARGKRLSNNFSEIERELEKNRRSLMLFAHQLSAKNAGQDFAQTPPDQEEMEELGNSRIITEDDWIEFRKRFNRVFPGFMPALKEQYPTITTAELRMAALLRLQLSSRESAAILGISGDSVKKLRQRLRKKMELDTENRLEEVLNTVVKK